MEVNKTMDVSVNEKMMGNMTPEHRDVMDNLVALTRMQLKNSTCFSMREAKYEWQEDRDDKGNQLRREPDFSILCGGRKRKRLVYIDVPRFIAEILSDRTEDEDRTVKMELYLRVGVEEYWLIDPRIMSVERYILDDDASCFLLHDKVDLNTSKEIRENLAPLLFPRLTMSFDDIFMGVGIDQ